MKTAATPILPIVGGATSKLSGATSALRSTIKVLQFILGFLVVRVSYSYSFFPDPEFDAGVQSGSRALMTKN